MCGFGGVINHYGPISEPRLKGIASKVNFRGPDSCGVRILDEFLNKTDTGRTAIFFNRLAIIDLDKRSDQPFEDDRHLLVFNGEIYNYAELRNLLEKEEVVFQTSSDTEVLFFALKRWGKQAITRLNGMFAFFWLDKKERTFLLCRDRLGIKPVYYHLSGESFYFGSELHSILRLTGKKPAISTRSVEMYLWMQFVPTPYTILEGIYKLPPGTFLAGTLNNPGANVQPIVYWDAYRFIEEHTEKKEDPNDTHLEQMLKESIQRQMQADVPLGLFLSSGVDSSLLAAMVNKYFANEKDVNFFTVSFGEKTFSDESNDALHFIKGFTNPRLKAHTLKVDPTFLQQHITNLYNYYDEPFGDSAAILNQAISRKAREHVTVTISGDGADELFWGYSRYNRWKAIQQLNAFPTLSSIIRSAAQLLPASPLKRGLKKNFCADPIERHFELFLMPGFSQILTNPIKYTSLWATTGIAPLRDRNDLPAILDLKTYLADAMLYKVDRSSMATSLEVRVPYLDNDVLEYALTLNFNRKSNACFKNKAILKELLLRIAPHYNINRPKKGFNFPLSSWLREHWKDQVLDSLTPAALSSVGLEPAPFVSILRDFYSKGKNNEVEVWYLFNLILWKHSFDKLAIR